MTEARRFPDETEELAAAVPKHLLEALRRYGIDQESIGGFLTACLRNDLHEAVCRADPESLAALKDIVLFIYNAMPDPCHGSKARVEEWLRVGDKMRAEVSKKMEGVVDQ